MLVHSWALGGLRFGHTHLEKVEEAHSEGARQDGRFERRRTGKGRWCCCLPAVEDRPGRNWGEGKEVEGEMQAPCAAWNLLELELKVGESPCPHLFPSFVPSLHLPVFPSVDPLRVSALFRCRVALEEPACPTRCAFVVSDLFPVDRHRFPCRGSSAGHHHGDVGTGLATEAQVPDAQVELEGPGAHLLVACVVAVLPF